MDTVKLLLALILLVKTGVDGSGRSCPSAAVVDLTETQTPDSSGFAYKSGELYPPGSTWYKNGKTLGCPCRFKKCIQLCCPAINAISETGCDKDAFFDSQKDLRSIVNEICSAHEPLVKKYYRVFEEFDFARRNDFAEYCSNRKWHLVNMTGICADEEAHGSLVWSLGCLSVSILFAAAALIVCNVITRHKNLHDTIFRCYLASYISSLLSFTVLLLRDELSSETVSTVVKIVGFVGVYGCLYFGAAHLLWLSVMNFHIWITFRNIKSLSLKEREAKTYVRYSMIVWGGSAVFVLSLIVSILYEDTLKLGTFRLVNCWLCFTVFTTGVIFVCNTCLYVSTASAIKKPEVKKPYRVNDVEKRHQENELWLDLYLKLFVATCVAVIFWAIGIYLKSEIFWRVAYLLEALRGIFVLLYFLNKRIDA